MLEISLLSILCIALLPHYGDSSGAILEVPFKALLHLSEFSRLSVRKIGEGIREVKETAILINSTFGVWEFFGRSLVHPRFVFGLLHGVDIQGTREGNLKKSTFE